MSLGRPPRQAAPYTAEDGRSVYDRMAHMCNSRQHSIARRKESLAAPPLCLTVAILAMPPELPEGSGASSGMSISSTTTARSWNSSTLNVARPCLQHHSGHTATGLREGVCVCLCAQHTLEGTHDLIIQN